MLTVLWHDEESAGYTDLFPDDWFSKEGSRLGRTHDTANLFSSWTRPG